MAKLFRVAGIQMNVTDDISQNIVTISQAIERASAAGADISFDARRFVERLLTCV